MADDIPETFSAEYKDGQLQIIEVGSYGDGDNTDEGSESAEPMPSTSGLQDDGDEMKYLQVMDTSGNEVMHLDLLNFTLVKCGDEPHSEYRLVANSELSGLTQDEIITNIITSDEDDERVTEDAFQLTDTEDTYVVVEKGPEESVVFLKTPVDTKMHPVNLPKPVATPAQIIERAKALQKAKGPVRVMSKPNRVKRKSDLPSPQELLASPNFKLFLYSCKVCDFKCNAIKELTEHKAKSHVGRNSVTNQNKIRDRAAMKISDSMIMQRCHKCPFLTYSRVQLSRHIKEKHANKKEPKSSDDDDDDERESAVDILVCGACGFESTIKTVFKEHIDTVHRTRVSL